MKGKKAWVWITIFTCLWVLLAAIPPMPVSAAADGPVICLEVKGTITSGQSRFIRRQITEAENKQAQLLAILLDTPGGLVDATKEITEAFFDAKLPVAVLVAPSGSFAASAGSFITIAADIAAMAPGTTIGAAHPVALTAEGTREADDKTVKFLAEHMSGLAKEKGRPEDIVRRFVTENLTLTSRDALDLGVIDCLAGDLSELLAWLDGRQVEKHGKTYTLNLDHAVVEYRSMNRQERFQHWLSDPQIAFVLLILGILGLYFGFSTPGTLVPEILGGILLILGIYGIGLFDTSTTGIILLVLGIGLIVAEIFTAGFGILGIGGGLSLLAGAILLPREPLMASDWYSTFRSIVLGAVLALVSITLLVLQRVIHSRRHRHSGSEFFKPPQTGRVEVELNPSGMIKARGELWQARSEDGQTIPVGTEVEVTRADSLTLWVRPVTHKTKD